MLSVICFNLDQSKILSSSKELTTQSGLYMTLRKALLKTFWEKEKMLVVMCTKWYMSVGVHTVLNADHA